MGNKSSRQKKKDKNKKKDQKEEEVPAKTESKPPTPPPATPKVERPSDVEVPAAAAAAEAAAAPESEPEPAPAESPGEQAAAKVATVVKWTGEAASVAVNGTFNNWGDKVPLESTDDGFAATIDMPPGENLVRFCVDDDWTVDKDLPVKNNDKDEECNVIMASG